MFATAHREAAGQRAATHSRPGRGGAHRFLALLFDGSGSPGPRSRSSIIPAVAKVPNAGRLLFVTNGSAGRPERRSSSLREAQVDGCRTSRRLSVLVDAIHYPVACCPDRKLVV